MEKAEAIEIILSAVDNAARATVSEFGIDVVMEYGGVEFLWKHLMASVPEAEADVRQLLAVIQLHEEQVKRRLAGILGLA